MTWRHRKGGQWSAPTIKKRKNGQWVTIGGGGGGGTPTGEFQWRDPPTRSNTIYTSVEGGLQAGLNALTADTELVIDDGPYSGTYTHDTSHTTVRGGGTGTTINLPSSQSDPIIRWPQDSYTGTDVTSPIVAGDTTIQVGSTTPFSAGDDVRILDTSQVYRGLTRLGTSGNATTGEFQTIDSVGSGSITLVDSADRDYPDNSGTLRVSRVDWAMEDIHYDNIHFSGYSRSNTGSNRAIQVNRAAKDFWLTNIDIDTFRYRGFDSHEAYNLYVDNMNVSKIGTTSSTGGTGNGITISVGTKNAIIRNTTVDDVGHYGINSGWDGTFNPAINHYYINCSVTNGADAAYDQHNGSENVHFINCTGQSPDIGTKLRSLGTVIDGGSLDSGYHGFQMTQKAEDVSITGLEIPNSSRTFTFWPKEHYDIENFVVRDSQFTASDRLVWWRPPKDTTKHYTANVEFHNCSINGNWVTDYHLAEEPPNASKSWITVNPTTSQPTGKTPAEYFA